MKSTTTARTGHTPTVPPRLVEHEIVREVCREHGITYRNRDRDPFRSPPVLPLHALTATPPLPTAARQDGPRAPTGTPWEPPRYSTPPIEAFLVGHSANYSTERGIGWPTALAKPVVGTPDDRRRNSGVHNLDAAGGNTGIYHDCAYRVRDRYEGIDPVQVFQPNLFRRERDTPRDDKSRFSLADQCDSRHRVRACVVRMDDIRVPLAGDCPELAGGAKVPLSAQGQAVCGKPRFVSPADERRACRRDDERTIAEIAKARGQQKYLTLAASPAAPGVDVENPGKIHYVLSCRANALNRPRSHGSGESVISSGCNCPAITHQF